MVILICDQDHWSFLLVGRPLGDRTIVHHIDSSPGGHLAPSILAVITGILLR
jgi:hypothetical protein